MNRSVTWGEGGRGFIFGIHPHPTDTALIMAFGTEIDPVTQINSRDCSRSLALPLKKR